jgi:hypothetical protein
MKAKFSITFLVLFTYHSTIAQTHRLKFKYRITQSKVTELAMDGIILTDALGTPVNICNNGVLKCLITNSNGTLTIDPWAITPATDPCIGAPGIVNSNTPYPLRFDISRGHLKLPGTPTLVGHPTVPVTFHYQTWLIGVNTFAVKFRPRVKDFNDNEYSSNAISGSINAGLTVAYSFGWTTFTHRSSSSWSVSPAFSLGLGSASLSKEPLKEQKITTYNPSNFVLSPSLGLIVARNDIGIFFAYGHDFMTGENANAWAYQKKRFLGIGLSASFKL